MQRLSLADLEATLDFIGEAAGVDGPDPFPDELLERLRLLIGSEGAGYCELDRVRRRLLGSYGVGTVGTGPIETYWRLRHQHPACMHEDRTGDFSPRKVSDFLSAREFHRLEIYADFFRPNAVEYEICVGLPAPMTHTKVFLFGNTESGGDFTERDRSILELLEPHLVRLYRDAQARRRADLAVAALATTNEPLVLLGSRGEPEHATESALLLLERFGFGLEDVPDVAPLTVRELRPSVLVLEEVRPLGLTGRERQILTLVADGLTNAEIAAALWISPQTVRKHLENVYAKLGVGTRAAAVRRAQEHGVLGRRVA